MALPDEVRLDIAHQAIAMLTAENAYLRQERDDLRGQLAALAAERDGLAERCTQLEQDIAKLKLLYADELTRLADEMADYVDVTLCRRTTPVSPAEEE
jgi:cell division protein FtsB